MIRVRVVTSNPGKLREFQRELSILGMELEHAKVEYDEIQTERLEDVVRHGLKELKDRGLDNFIIDDSGLFINSLKGFPGVYSAYALKTLGCRGILSLLEGEKDRSAHFECCIGSSISGLGDIVVCEKAHGAITHREKGDDGFGFDPIFQPHGESRTYAELPLDEKNLISHRGKAIRSFHRLLEERMGRL